MGKIFILFLLCNTIISLVQYLYTCLPYSLLFISMQTTTRSTRTLFNRKNSQLQNMFFNTVTIISYAFSPAMNNSLHVVLIKISTRGGNPLSLLPLLKCTTHHLTVHMSTVWSPQTFSKCQRMSMGAIFSTCRNSMTYLCSMCPSVSDAILSD